MNLKIFFLMFLFISANAFSNCNNIEGKYSTHGGSEYMTYINMLKDNKFILKHESWQPSNYNNKKIIQSKGTWSCSNNQLIIRNLKLIHKAEYIAIGENPLGINSKTMAIYFRVNDVDHYLNNEILYPVASLNN